MPCAGRHYGAVMGGLTAMAVPVMRQWKRWSLDHIVSVSRAVADRNGVAESGVPSSVIPNFVPDDLVTNSASPGSDDFLFFAGDLSRDKGIDVLLDAYARLDGPPPLRLVGRRQPETPAVLPPGVGIDGPWPHARIVEAFRRCTVAVLPSAWPDPCPTTVLEAMAAGRPVVTTSTGGMVDMVEDGVSGLLVPPSDVTALADALRRLISDRGLRDRLGAGARTRVAQFTASSVTSRIEDVYRKVSSL
jgi:glycosyltransferase involved in cell wall biosynthesis